MQNVYDALRKEDDNCQAALKEAQDRYQAISIGQFSTDSGGTATLQDQLMIAKNEMSTAVTEIKMADSKIKDNAEQTKKKQVEMKKTEAEYKRDSGSIGNQILKISILGIHFRGRSGWELFRM